MEGIKESKEALIALNALSVKLISLIKKHASAVEMMASILSDDELKSELGAAIEGIKQVPAEMKDLSLAEGIELAALQIQALPQLIAALKG